MEELDRRLDRIGGFIDGVSQRIEQNMPSVTPPYPNRLLRRRKVAEMIDKNPLSVDLASVKDMVPESYATPESIKQLLEE